MEQLINFIIRPPRAEYDPKNDLLEQEFTLRGKIYQRKDIEVKNSRGDVLQCSHYMPIVDPEGKSLPCVIYCHGNSGCRADGSEAAIILLPSNITVFTLDFSGSGLSEGEHVTLGWNEKDDLRAVVDYLRADGNVSMIGLWGRSMGAVTSLMYGAEDPSIAGMVLDSPFSDLVDLMMELVDTSKFRLPKFTVKFAIQYMRRAIQKKAKFDIIDLNTIKVAKSSFVPVLIGHAIDDDFIRPHHSDRIHDAYMGDKNIIKFEGDHNSPRPQFYFDSINIFFHNVLQPPEDDFGDIFIESMPHYFGKGNWGAVQDHVPSISSKESGTNIPSDANKQPHPRRPMSRTEVPSGLPSEDCSTQVEDENSDNDVCSSSSKMISFEFSNGHQYEPRAPTLIEDDDLYVEYQLDDLSGFPCNAEEEERMIMAAMIESLKEFQPKISEADECVPSNDTNSLESSNKDYQEKALISEQCGILERETTSTSSDITLQSKVDSTSTSVEAPLASKPELTSSELPFPDKSELILNQAINASNSSESTQNSSEVDLSANTTATLTVVRNPSGHIMDGLIRRWDLNFFKNNQNR